MVIAERRVGSGVRNERHPLKEALVVKSVSDILLSAAITGTVASLTTTAALAALAKTEGKGALQPTNSTSHWLHGGEAGRVDQADAAHTLVGYGTHHASAFFWALPFQAWLAARPPRSTGELLRNAAVMAGIAATVDYGLVPKRLTPGWEEVLSKRSIAVTFAAMALGLAAGAAISGSLEQQSRRQQCARAVRDNEEKAENRAGELKRPIAAAQREVAIAGS